ncbi:MAG: glycosyltransferase [Agathobacter sp.]|nr:glycosyltransferase [Agathobacter sp.]
MKYIEKIKRGFKKVVNYCKRYGVLRTIKKVLRTVYYRLKFRLAKKVHNPLEGVFGPIEQYSTVIIFENNFGWGKIMKQRPQQIAENLPEDVLMIYHSHEDEDYERGKRVRVLKNNLVLADLGYVRDDILNYFACHNNKYLMIYSTDYIPHDRIVMYEEYRYKVIYEYVDDLNEELSGDIYDDLVERHQLLLKDENVYVVSTATALKNNIEAISDKKPELITNGVDYEHFKYREIPVPEDLKPIRDSYKTVICYYGALAMWFDYELMKKVAANKDYAVVLMGQDYDGTYAKSGLKEFKNVFYLGRKGYDELPAYGCNVDVCIIPFVINDITEATSPVKLFEYMAMAKPIVTTALPECRKYSSVFFSESHEEFIENLTKAVEKKDDVEYQKLLMDEALDNTWASKAKKMIQFVNGQRMEAIQNDVMEVLKNEKYSRIVVWRSPFGWDVPLFQRPQHIARQLAAQDCLVFYEVSPSTDHIHQMKKIETNLYLVDFTNYIMKEILENCLEKHGKNVYIQIYSTNWSMSMEEVKAYEARGFKLLYEYIDDISPELAGTDEIPPYILDKYNYAMENKDVPVVTTARQIYEDVVNKRGAENMVLACNGVDYNFFQDISDEFEYEEDFLKIVNNGKINMGYYGALASWFDYDLIKKINATNKYNIVLIGIEYDDSYKQSGIDALDNVYFIGPKEYKILKYYANKMDILTIPFVINDITQATSPLKLFEYMALHKPIVTSAMQECMNYKSVMIGNSHDHFIEMLDKAATLVADEEYLKLLDEEARENDWSHKAKLMVELLQKNESGK